MMTIEELHWILALVVCNTLLLVSANYFAIKTNPYPRALISKAFYISAIFSQMFLYAAVLGVIQIGLTIVLKKVGLFLPICSLFSLILVILLLINSVLYSIYRFNISKWVLHLINPGLSEIFQAGLGEVLVGLVAIVIVLSLSTALEAGLWIENKNTFLFIASRYGIYLLALNYLIFQLSHVYLYKNGHNTTLQYSAKVYGLHHFSLVNAFKKFGVNFETEKNKHILNARDVYTMKSGLHYPLHPIQQNKPHTPLNVLIIGLDAWRYDMLNDDVTPNLSNFSKRCKRYLNHWSSGNVTQSGLFGLFYGLPGIYWDAAKKDQVPSILIQTLQDNDYQLGIYSSATLRNPAFNKTVFCSVKDLPLHLPGKDPLARDKMVTKKMIEFIKNRDKQKPFFGFAFYDSTHGYYAAKDLPEKFSPTKRTNHITLNKNTDPKPIFNLYKNAAYAIDQSVDELLQMLESEGLLENTMVIITADHGQEFNDSKTNAWEHPNNFGKYQVQVPLAIYTPGESAETIHYMTTHYDIVPTLMQNVLGVTNPTSDYSIGSPLSSAERNPFVILTNYTNFGLLYEGLFVNLLMDGQYQVHTNQFEHLEHMEINKKYLNDALTLMKKYYQ